MSIKTDKAAQNHQKGYNCAQAVACAFAEEMGIDESIIFKMMEGHGLGMGCMEGTCGAITGAVAVIGAIKSCGDIEKPVSKAATYKLTGELLKYRKQQLYRSWTSCNCISTERYITCW